MSIKRVDENLVINLCNSFLTSVLGQSNTSELNSTPCHTIYKLFYIFVFYCWEDDILRWKHDRKIDVKNKIHYLLTTNYWNNRFLVEPLHPNYSRTATGWPSDLHRRFDCRRHVERRCRPSDHGQRSDHPLMACRDGRLQQLLIIGEDCNRENHLVAKRKWRLSQGPTASRSFTPLAIRMPRIES